MDLKIYREHDFNGRLSELVSDIIISDREAQVKFSERDLIWVMSRLVEITQEIQRSKYGPVVIYGNEVITWNGREFNKI